MSIVYIEWQDGNRNVFLELTVTTEVSVDEISQVTEHPVQAGFDIADHLINKNKKYSIKGMVSNIKSYLISVPEDQEGNRFISGTIKPNQKNVTDYFSEIDKLRKSKSLVKFYFDPQIDNDGIPNCVLTKINYTRQPSHGNAYLLNLELEQVRVSTSVSLYEERNLANKDLNDGEQSKGANSTVSDEPSITLLTNIGLTVADLATISSDTNGEQTQSILDSAVINRGQQ